MNVRKLLYVVSCFFWAQAEATFFVEDELTSSIEVPFSNHRNIYTLTTSHEANNIPKLVFTSEEDEPRTSYGVSFEEDLNQVKNSNFCLLASTNKIYALDSDIRAIDFQGDEPLEIHKGKSLLLNNCTINSKSPVILKGNEIKAQGFVSAPQIIIQSSDNIGSITQFILQPQPYIIKSLAGFPIINKTMYISIAVNFDKNEYNLRCQGAFSILIKNDNVSIKKEKRKTSSYTLRHSKRQKKII